MRQETKENAVYGFAAGAVTGAAIAPFERAKVIHQVNKNIRYRDLLRPRYYGAYAKAMPSFAFFFGTACSIEFATNEKVKQNYGVTAGLCAAAFGGALFLTSADRFMYEHEHGLSYKDSAKKFAKNPRALIAGLTPMLFREGCYGLSVFIFGPMLGDYLNHHRGNKKVFDNKIYENLFWLFAGTFLSGLMTTTLSQPFDSVTREMQRLSNQGMRPSFYETAKRMSMKEAYRGYPPRLALATIGGAMVGTVFKALKYGETPFQEKNTSASHHP